MILLLSEKADSRFLLLQLLTFHLKIKHTGIIKPISMLLITESKWQESLANNPYCWDQRETDRQTDFKRNEPGVSRGFPTLHAKLSKWKEGGLQAEFHFIGSNAEKKNWKSVYRLHFREYLGCNVQGLDLSVFRLIENIKCFIVNTSAFQRNRLHWRRERLLTWCCKLKSRLRGGVLCWHYVIPSDTLMS